MNEVRWYKCRYCAWEERPHTFTGSVTHHCTRGLIDFAYTGGGGCPEYAMSLRCRRRILKRKRWRERFKWLIIVPLACTGLGTLIALMIEALILWRK